MYFLGAFVSGAEKLCHGEKAGCGGERSGRGNGNANLVAYFFLHDLQSLKALRAPRVFVDADFFKVKHIVKMVKVFQIVVDNGGDVILGVIGYAAHAGAYAVEAVFNTDAVVAETAVAGNLALGHVLSAAALFLMAHADGAAGNSGDKRQNGNAVNFLSA